MSKHRKMRTSRINRTLAAGAVVGSTAAGFGVLSALVGPTASADQDLSCIASGAGCGWFAGNDVNVPIGINGNGTTTQFGAANGNVMNNQLNFLSPVVGGIGANTGATTATGGTQVAAQTGAPIGGAAVAPNIGINPALGGIGGLGTATNGATTSAATGGGVNTALPTGGANVAVPIGGVGGAGAGTGGTNAAVPIGGLGVGGSNLGAALALAAETVAAQANTVVTTVPIAAANSTGGANALAGNDQTAGNGEGGDAGGIQVAGGGEGTGGEGGDAGGIQVAGGGEVGDQTAEGATSGAASSNVGALGGAGGAATSGSNSVGNVTGGGAVNNGVARTGTAYGGTANSSASGTAGGNIANNNTSNNHSSNNGNGSSNNVG
jgi:hypothetical protein